MTTVEYQIGASLNDLRCAFDASDIPVISKTQAVFGAGYQSTTVRRVGSLARFGPVNIPQGAIIDVAYLKLRCLTSRTEDTVRSKLWCEAVDNATDISDAGFTVEDLFDGGNNLLLAPTSKVTWEITADWVVGTDYNSASIVAPVQAVIGRAGWASSNYINVAWEDWEGLSTATANTYRYARSWDSSSIYAPILHIEYSTWGEAALSASGTLVAVGRLIAQDQATLAGSGAMTAAGRLIAQGVAILSGSGTLTAAACRVLQGSAALSAAGSLTATGLRTAFGAAVLSGSASQTAAGRLIARGADVLSGTGSLTALSGALKWGASTLSATGLSASAGFKVAKGTATLSASGTMTAICRITAWGTSVLSGSSTMTAAGRRLCFNTASLAGIGTMTAVGRLTAQGRAVLSAIGTLVADTLGGTAIKVLTEYLTLSDSRSLFLQKSALVDTISLTDVVKRGLLNYKVLTESIALVGSMLRTTKKRLTEVLSLISATTSVVLEVRCASDADDVGCYYNGSSYIFSTNETALVVGHCNATRSRCGAAIRFSNVTLPPSVIVDAAYVELTADG